MKQILGAFRRTSFGTVAALFLLAAVAVALPPREASAAGLLFRSLQLSSTRGGDLPILDSEGNNFAPGTAGNGQQVGHTYIFQTPSAALLDAVVFQYCSGPFEYLGLDSGGVEADCVTPTGFDTGNVTSASVSLHASRVDAEAGANPVGGAGTYNVSGGATDKQIVIEPSAVGQEKTPSASQFVRVHFAASPTNYFKNPNSGWTNSLTTPSETFFVHIETYADATNVTTDNHTDEGTVTTSTANSVDIETRVQEVLKFSVEAEDGVAGPSTTEDTECNALGTTTALNIGDPANSNSLSTDTVYDGYSYFRLATNSSKGARVLYAGDTLKSTAGDEIAAIGDAADTSDNGTEQFGLAIAGNHAENDVDNPVSADLEAKSPYEAGDTGTAAGDAVGNYAFDVDSNTTPVELARSLDVVSCDTGVVRYIANISNDTPAGIYTTKISYIAVPSY